MDTKYEKICIIIPAYDPDRKILDTVSNLFDAGFTNMIIVDDGSKKECQGIFAKLSENPNIHIVKHNINLGQGRAFKSAFNFYLGGLHEKCIGIVECDADGQHLTEDICKCADKLIENPDKFIIGVRDFDDKSVPFRSKFGNKLTSMIFKACCGMDICDTQTGLKGIPNCMIPLLTEARGERFEYASSTLLTVHQNGYDMLQYRINTVYLNGNESSHFKPVLDSVRIYSLLLKYIISSLSGFAVDIIFFALFISIFKYTAAGYIIAAAYLAKIISSAYSFFVKKLVGFKRQGSLSKASMKSILFCIIQAGISAALVSLLYTFLNVGVVPGKIIIDIVLFFAIYFVQSRWTCKKDK